MAVIVKKVQPQAVITEETKYKGKITSSEMKVVKVGEPIDAPEPHATVGFEAGRTVSDGNYGSFRVGVSLSMPCAPTKDGLEHTFAEVSAWCDQKMQQVLKEGGIS